MKTLNQINDIMESLRYATIKIDEEDIDYISEMMQTASKYDSNYAEAYSKLHEIFKHALPVPATESEPAIDKIDEMTNEAQAKINKMCEEAQDKIHQELEDIGENTIAQAEEEMTETIKTAQVPTSPSHETEIPIIFQHPDYPTIGAGTDGQIYTLKDGNWKKADARSVYFPKKKNGSWGRIERQEILDLLNNNNTEPQTESNADEGYETLPDGYFIHPTIDYLAADEAGRILKYDKDFKTWKIAEANEDSRGCRKIKGAKIGTAKCVYECINRRVVTSHVRHLNGDSWDDSFGNLTVYGDKNYHKFQPRTYDEADIHEICRYICKHRGDVSNISHDSKGKYSIYYARKILHKSIHDNISDKYFRYTSGGALYVNDEGEVK